MSNADQVRAEFTELWGQLASFWGISPAAARAFAHLFTLEEGATAQELREGLAMSAGAVSTATRELREWGLAAPVRQPRSRQVQWRVETDVERVVRTIVATRKRREWDPILEHVDRWLPELSGSKDAESVHVRERLETVRAIVKVADDMAQAFLRGGVVEKLGLSLLVKATKRRAKRPS
ncbi:GbsR/MarR family transcriptional regulator [Engelhardtia mirabilis]|uniref:HTH-type transcriptional regulator n=1 Tax=Engelhardtia mirabilis TaxID=2528011 RepID=A0A518BH81_9BACT|nr:hypothetical protein Pla133_14110 [Planctomycetes bacterium Pla133]QDV00667.1 hypothetical protein Pla86_14100 [Planctomycetes bacterium Pla86]